MNKTCILCGRESVAIGLYTPHDGSHAPLSYFVCEQHYDANDPKLLAKIEQALDRRRSEYVHN